MLRKGLLVLGPALDVLGQIAALAVVHHHAQLLLVHEMLVVAHDARVVQPTQDLDLLLSLLCEARVGETKRGASVKHRNQHRVRERERRRVDASLR